MLNTRALPPMQPVNTPTCTEQNTAADAAVSPAPSRSPQPRSADGSLKRLPVRQGNARPLGRPVMLRNPPPADVPHPLLAAARQPGIEARLADMRQYLAGLKTAYARGEEMEHPRDTQFLDVLVAMENARHPDLALSTHTIDETALKAHNPEAVASLARGLEASMRSGAGWHAVVCVNGREVALSARHDPEQPRHISLVVVDSARKHLSAPEWKLIAALIAGRLNHALAQADGGSAVKIRLHCLNTATQTISDGSAIFALSAAKAMPGDADIRRLHEDALNNAAQHAAPVGIQMIDDNRLLGARFFKHMTHAPRMKALLEARPDLVTQPVSKRGGQTLAKHQAARLRVHMPAVFGMRHAYSTSYEDKRLKLYERAIAHLDTSVRLDGMTDYLHDLRRASEGEATPPAPRDAEFLDLLIGAENKLDPQLRLSAHRVDTSKLAAHDTRAIDSLKPLLTEGLKSGADWHATLDLGGHHVAVAARHDAEHPHLSLAVVDGAGSPLSRQDWSDLARTLGKQFDVTLRATGDGRTGKVWLTRLDVSEGQTPPSTALFALMAAIGMKGDTEIAGVHREALAQARNTPATVAAGHFSRPDLIQLDGAENGAETADPSALDTHLKQEQIAMYERAIPHLERSLGLPPHTH